MAWSNPGYNGELYNWEQPLPVPPADRRQQQPQNPQMAMGQPGVPPLPVPPGGADSMFYGGAAQQPQLLPPPQPAPPMSMPPTPGPEMAPPPLPEQPQRPPSGLYAAPPPQQPAPGPLPVPQAGPRPGDPNYVRPPSGLNLPRSMQPTPSPRPTPPPPTGGVLQPNGNVPMAGGVPLNSESTLYPAASVNAMQSYLAGRGGGIPSGMSFQPGSVMSIAAGMPIPSWGRELTAQDGQRYMEVMADPSAPPAGGGGGGPGGAAAPLSYGDFIRRFGGTGGQQSQMAYQNYLDSRERQALATQETANRTTEAQTQRDRNAIMQQQADNERRRLEAQDPTSIANRRAQYEAALRAQNPNMPNTEIIMRVDQAYPLPAAGAAPTGAAPTGAPRPGAAPTGATPTGPTGGRPPGTNQDQGNRPPPMGPGTPAEQLAAAIQLMPGLARATGTAGAPAPPIDTTMTPAQFVARLQGTTAGRALFAADNPQGAAFRQELMPYLNNRFGAQNVRSNARGFHTVDVPGIGPVAMSGQGGFQGAMTPGWRTAHPLVYPINYLWNAFGPNQGQPTEEMLGGEYLRNINEGRW